MMTSKRQLGWVLAALMVLALAAGNLLAQSGENSGIPTNIGYPSNPPGPNDPGGAANAGNPTYDPPARVARIQYISGEVSLQPGGVNDWVAANLNRPLTTSDRVWTDKNSKVELNVGNAFIRMDSESSLTLTNVSNEAIQAELDQGVLELTVEHLEPGEIFEIDTPNLAFTVMKSGVYLIDVRPNDDQTWVTVRKGNGQATGNGPAVKVNSGDQVRFTGQNFPATRPRMRLLLRTASKTGPRCATNASMARNRPATSPPELSAIRTLTITAAGRLSQRMARSGFPPPYLRAGRLIATVTGYGSLRGAGPGSMTPPGASLPSIMAAGSLTADTGDGRQVPCMSAGVLTMRRPWWAGLVAQAGASASRSESASELVAAVAGSPWDGVNLTIPGITDTVAATLARLTFAMSTSPTRTSRTLRT